MLEKKQNIVVQMEYMNRGIHLNVVLVLIPSIQIHALYVVDYMEWGCVLNVALRLNTMVLHIQVTVNVLMDVLLLIGLIAIITIG